MPEPRRPILEPLRELDGALRRSSLSAEADARLRALVEGTPPPRRRWLPLGAALAAAAAALILLVLRPWRPAPPPPVGGFALISGQAEAEAGGAVRCASERCGLVVEELGASLRVERATALRRQPGAAIELVRGAATVSVARRAAGAAPVRFLVSHGAIEVLGTEFALAQGEGHGWVRLAEGKIRFRASDGRVRLLAPGDRLTWPLPPPARAPADAGPPPDAARRVAAPRRDAGRPLTVAQAESLLDEVERLRSQGRFAEVARRLRDALGRVDDAAMRERLSFELGSLLTQQLRDAREACAHWRRHLRRYGTARYGPEIRAAMRELACGD